MTNFDKDLLEYSNTKNDIIGKLTVYAKDFFPMIVLIFSIAMTVLTRLYQVGLKNPFDTEFLVNLGTNIATTMITYIVYVKYGNDMFKATSQAYKDNIVAWGERSGKIRKELSTDFIQYCKDYAKECVENARRMEFESHTLIPWAEYTANFEGKPKKSIKTLYKQGKLNRADYKSIVRANKPRKAPQIEPVSILCGSDCSRIEKIPSGRRNYTLGKIVSRPFAMLLLSIGTAIISPAFLGVESATVIFSLVSSTFQILFAGISGNSAGNASARQEASAVKSRIYFLDNFFASIGK